MPGGSATALVGGAGTFAGLTDYNNAKKLQKKQKGQVKKTEGVYLDALTRMRQLGAKGEKAQLGIVPMLQKNEKRALGVSAGIGRSATQGVLDQGRQNMASVQQQLVNSGLYNSGRFASAARGVSATQNRGLADIQSGLAGVQSGIIQQSGLSQANAMQGLSGFYGNQSAQEAAIMSELARFLGGVQYQGGPSILGSLGGLAKLFMAGGGGGLGAPGGMAQGYGNTFGGGGGGSGGLF